jgi:hypothetical protein
VHLTSALVVHTFFEWLHSGQMYNLPHPKDSAERSIQISFRYVDASNELIFSTSVAHGLAKKPITAEHLQTEISA